MDQLKEQLAVVAKYGFWIGTVLVLIGSVAVWYMATSTLAEETADATRKLSGKVNKINSVRGELDSLPNDLSHEKMRQLVEQRQAEVLQAWETLFERQKDYLTWPDYLDQELVAQYRDKIPIEYYLDFPPRDDQLRLEETERELYPLKISREPEQLAAIAKAEWSVEFDSGRRQDSSDENDAAGFDDIVVVAWNESSQKSLLDDLFPWRGQVPTTLEIYYSQENLWILKQLMMIIKDVNGEATQPYQAKIHEINEIRIGKSVQFGAGDIEGAAGGSLTAPTMPGSSPGGGSMSQDALRQGLNRGGGSPAGDGRQNTQDPADGRYVNDDLENISAMALRSALRSNKPADASLAVAKRVPIMMGLKMDQLAVHELLAACGSADLMVEVAQVRLLGEGGSRSSSSSSAPSGGGAGGSQAAELSAGLSGRSSGSTSNRSASSPTESDFPLDVDVEIYGMIYIYNPPDPEKLPVEQVTNENVEEAIGETPTDVTEPASQPAGDEGSRSEPLQQSVGELQPPADPQADSGPDANPPAGDEATPPTDAAESPGPDAVPPPGNAEPAPVDVAPTPENSAASP